MTRAQQRVRCHSMLLPRYWLRMCWLAGGWVISAHSDCGVDIARPSTAAHQQANSYSKAVVVSYTFSECHRAHQQHTPSPVQLLQAAAAACDCCCSAQPHTLWHNLQKPAPMDTPQHPAAVHSAMVPWSCSPEGVGGLVLRLLVPALPGPCRAPRRRLPPLPRCCHHLRTRQPEPQA